MGTYEIAFLQLHELGAAHALVHVVVVCEDAFAVERALETQVSNCVWEEKKGLGGFERHKYEVEDRRIAIP
jgi:hypothetical protein